MRRKMRKLKTEIKCAACKTTKSIFSFGITYAPRTTPDKGWLNRQCKDCYIEGGIEMETRHIQAELDKRTEQMNELKEEIKDLRTLLRHIERKTVMRDDGTVIAKED
jgi:hypothetical protein